MLWIEAGNKKDIFHNEVTDDFIRFLPKSFRCNPGDIAVWVIHNDSVSALKAQMQMKDDYVRWLVRGGDTLVLRVLEKKNEDGENGLIVIEEHSFMLTPATRSWPYEEKDGKLKFIGLM